MRKIYSLCLLLVLGLSPLLTSGQTTVVINTGTAGTPAYNAGPIYRSSNSSAYDASRYAYLYTQSELAAAGIVTGSVITQLGWVKNNNATTTGGAIFRIYMKNSAATAYSAATETWANLSNGTSMVYENLSQAIPATVTPNYITFALTSPGFTYTGGSLEILTEWDINQVSGNPTTGTFDWLWSTVPDRIYGTGNTTLAPITSLSSTTNSISALTGRRPFLQITFTPGAACTNPPTAGTATADNTGTVCPTTPVLLGLTGNSTGSGLTFQWESSATNTPFTPTSISTPAPAAALTVNPATTTWYRAKVVCNNGTPVYSTPVQVSVANGLPAGTYSINSGSPTGGTNYTSFADAISALSCGIAGPVIFNVTPNSGPYVETVSFPNILGTSAVNTVKINGNGNTVQFDNTATNRQMLTLSGTKYLKIDSLKFKTLNTTYGWAALITNGCAYDSITRCTFDLTSITTTTSGNSSGICFSASNTTPTTAGANGSQLYIGGNTIKGGTGSGGPYYGITVCGTSDSNVIERNLLENFYLYGIYVSAATGTKVKGNELHRRTKTAVSTFYGIYTTGTTPGTLVTGNRVHSPGGTVGTSTSSVYALYSSGDGTATNKNLFSNNVVYNVNQGGTIYGIYNPSTLQTDFIHNTIDISVPIASTSTSTVYGIYVSGTSTNANVRNNIVSITGGTGGTKYGFYYSSATSIADASRNNYYVNSTQSGTQNYGYYTTAYATMAAFQAAYPTMEVGSVSQAPQYLDPANGNLLPLNNSLFSNGTNTQALVATDINGVARTTTPTPGAFQIAASQINNAGALALIQPTGSFCSGPRPVKASIINAGVNTINTVEVHWTVNGVTQPTLNYATPITGIYSSDNIDTVTLGTGVFPAGVASVVKVWTSQPNGQADGFNANDTFVATVQPSYSVVVNLGNDTAICTQSSLSLNAGNPGATYLWNNGSTSQSVTAATAGAYIVTVTDAGGCVGIDTLNLTLKPLPVVNLGNDTAICPGTTLVLDAGNPGGTYLWDDGSTTQTRGVSAEATYHVAVTVNGCTASDAIDVSVIDAPVADGINAVYGDTATYTFNVHNPRYALTYTWDFGDGTPVATGTVVQHTYARNGIYLVTLTMGGYCNGNNGSVKVTVDVFDAKGATGITDKNKTQDWLLYPNPAKNYLLVESKSGKAFEQIEILTVTGQRVFVSDKAATQLRIETGTLAPGVYLLKVGTGKGTEVRKFEILK